MTYFEIYLLGVLASYIFCDIIRGDVQDSNQEEDRLYSFLLSLMSWIFLILGIIIIIIHKNKHKN